MNIQARKITEADHLIDGPEAAHPKPDNGTAEGREENDPAEREAMELRTYSQPTTADSLQLQSHAPVPDQNGDFTRPASSTQTRRSGYGRGLERFWNRQIAMTVPHIACRDHLALERTYLGYLRTSLALAMLGVVVAQLFRLQHVANPDSIFGFYVLGKPIAGLFIGAAILVILLGAFRFWRQQNAIVRNKIHAAGWEVYTMGAVVMSLTVLMFAIVLAVEIDRDIGKR